MVLLPNHNALTAAALAERIRASVEDVGLGLTVSIGVAEVTQNVETAIRAADIALYRAKDLGRNRVVMA